MSIRHLNLKVNKTFLRVWWSFQRFDNQPQADDVQKTVKLKWCRVQFELAADTVIQMAQFLDKSIEKLEKQKQKGEKKVEKVQKKHDKTLEENTQFSERIALLEAKLAKSHERSKTIKNEADAKYSKLLEEMIQQMNQKFEILATENDRLNSILSRQAS